MSTHLNRSWFKTKFYLLGWRERKVGHVPRSVDPLQPGRVMPSVLAKKLVLSFLALSMVLLVVNQPTLAEAIAYQPQMVLARGWDGKIAPQLQEDLATFAAGEMATVIVTLGDQANLSQIRDRNRSVRINRVINALQNKAEASQRQIIAFLENRQSGGEVDRFESYWVFNGLIVTATAGVIDELALRPEVSTITPNSSMLAPAASLAQSSGSPLEPNLDLINTQALWNLGFRGQGIVVAAMDTGVYLNHTDLFTKWRGGTNSWYDPNGEHPAEPFDVNGHGTNILGVLVGGEASGTAIGVAPEAQWIAVKIFNDQGVATVAGIHSGFQWLLDPDGNPLTPDSPHVVNNSWTFQNPGCDLEFELDLQALRAVGILPIFAAGNGGPGAGTSISPSNNPSAFAAGATDNFNQMYASSSRGPSNCGEPDTVFPELTAPGVSIHTSDLYGLYTSATGTSLAAPHVAGGLALLLQAFPGLLVNDQEAALINGALDLGAIGPDNDFGFGRLDLLASYQWLVNRPPDTPTPEPAVNLALNKPVMVSSFQDGSHDGNMAVDGNLETFWQTERTRGKNKPPSEWITIDLGSSTSISQVVLEWDENFATSYTIQASDDNSSWMVLSSTSNGDGGNDTHAFATISARFMKMEATGWSSESLRNWLQEFGIYAESGGGADPTPTPTPTPPPGGGASLHVGDLDGSSSPGSRNRWEALVVVTIHDAGENPVAGATVSGSWSAGGSSSCVSDSLGQCSLAKGNLRATQGSVTFTVENISHPASEYLPADNHDPEGDSDGTSLTISSP